MFISSPVIIHKTNPLCKIPLQSLLDSPKFHKLDTLKAAEITSVLWRLGAQDEGTSRSGVVGTLLLCSYLVEAAMLLPGGSGKRLHQTSLG